MFYFKRSLSLSFVSSLTVLVIVMILEGCKTTQPESRAFPTSHTPTGPGLLSGEKGYFELPSSSFTSYNAISDPFVYEKREKSLEYEASR